MASSRAAPAQVEGERHLAVLAAALDRGVERAEQAGIAAPRRSDAVAGRQAAWPAARRPASGRSSTPLGAGSTAICALPRRAARSPLSSAGITLVSLNTSASPGCEQAGRSRTARSAIPARPQASTTSSRAASRGLAGRKRDPLLRQVEIERSTRIDLRRYSTRTISAPTSTSRAPPTAADAQAAAPSAEQAERGR